MGKICPKPNNKTLAKAGTNCVVVTNTLTQFSRSAIIFRHFKVKLCQLSVAISISERIWSQWSLFVGPKSPPTLKKIKNFV